MPRVSLATRADLLDVNVWLALAIESHVHHDRARAYWRDQSTDRIAFCRVTALAFARLCTNPHVTAGAPFTVRQAWQAYEALRALPEVILVAEPDGCEAKLAEWAAAGVFTPKLWTDAYLAAFAVSGQMRLVTFDAGFQQFDGLAPLLLGEQS